MDTIPLRPPSLADDVAYLAVQVAKVAQRDVTARLADHGLRPPQATVLIALDDLGPLSQQQLADRLDMDKSHVVGVVDELAAAGLVRRERDPDDRRCYRLVVTDEGRRRLPSLRAVAGDTADAVAGDLDDAARAQLERLLRHLVGLHDSARLGAAAAGTPR